MDDIFDYFSNIQDPRSFRNQKHPLKTLIGTTFLASLSGIDSFSGFSDYTASHIDSLESYFDFPNGVPSHDTYQRLWNNIDPGEFYSAFDSFTATLSNIKSDIISLECLFSQENDKGHGRLEQRCAYLCEDISWLQGSHNWPGLKGIGMVKCRVERKNKISEETRYYICSIAGDAKLLNDAARAHWGIESAP